MEKSVENTAQSQPIGVDGGQYLGTLTKKCSKCVETKPLESFSWGKKGVNRGGICKPCAALITRKWREDNPDRYKALKVAQKESYHADPEYTREKAKQWYLENTERAKANKKAWYEGNKERLAELDKERRRSFPEKFAEWSRQWRYNNLERSRYHRRKYKSTHSEHVKAVNRIRVLARHDEVVAKQREWAKANPERVREIAKRWRDRNPGNWVKRRLAQVTPPWTSSTQIKSVYAQAAKLSRATGEKIDVDHIYPLQGKTVCGLHTPANLRPLKRSENRAKGNKLPGHLKDELWETSPRMVYKGDRNA